MNRKKPKVRTYEWLKWRWEFMRRNPEYRKDFDIIKQNWVKYNWEPFPVMDDYLGGSYGEYRYSYGPMTKNNLYLESHECELEKKLCEKWGLNSPPMLNPEESYDFVAKNFNPDTKMGDIPIKELHQLEKFWHMQQALSSNAVETMGKPFFIENYQKDSDLKERKLGGVEIKEEKFIGEHLVLHINFAEVNSISALKTVVADLIQTKFKYYCTYYERETIWASGEKIYMSSFDEDDKKDKRYLTDYDVILLAGDMEKEGVKIPEIARTIFPNDFRNANDETAIRKVRQYIKKYKELVNGEYITLKFP
jgi:hypothetical protein